MALFVLTNECMGQRDLGAGLVQAMTSQGARGWRGDGACLRTSWNTCRFAATCLTYPPPCISRRGAFDHLLDSLPAKTTTGVITAPKGCKAVENSRAVRLSSGNISFTTHVPVDGRLPYNEKGERPSWFRDKLDGAPLHFSVLTSRRVVAARLVS